MKEHLTERGALLGDLESRCVEPGLWWVEGLQVSKLKGWWYVDWPGDRWATRYRTFTRALTAVSEWASQGRPTFVGSAGVSFGDPVDAFPEPKAAPK